MYHPKKNFTAPIFPLPQKFAINVSLGVSICLDVVSIETLDRQISTASRQISKISTCLDKSRQSRQKSRRVKVSTEKSWFKKSRPRKKKSWSRHFKKVCLDTKDVLDLDLDWSRLSRPPTLHKRHRPSPWIFKQCASMDEDQSIVFFSFLFFSFLFFSLWCSIFVCETIILTCLYYINRRQNGNNPE